MYVVRIDLPEDGRQDFKVFERLPDAKKRFARASSLACEGDDVIAAFLFEVPGISNPREAVGVVKAGTATLLERDPWDRIGKELRQMIENEFGHGSDA